MHCAASLEGEEAEPHEVFAALGILLTEGRVPGANDRGYGEGPHCPGLGAKQRATLPHQCDPQANLLCRREVEFRKRMLLLWQSGVPMSVEVLVCPDCACGAQRAQSAEPTVRPSPSDLLLEQWTITALTHKSKDEGGGMGVRALLQAVRSQLFFSQLGAWFSSSGGRSPQHVCYRLTVPGEAFASHFQKQPVEHSFPAVRVGRPNNRVTFQVSLKSLPRGEEGLPPRLPCCRPGHEGVASTEASSSTAAPPPLSTKESCVASLAPSGSAQKKRSRDESEGPLLGESLLDAPQRRERRGVVSGAGRYQSPSRRVSPSLETPDHLPFLPVDGIVPEEGKVSQPRVTRQGLARRRDMRRERGGLVDDGMHTGCTRPGKHHCCQDTQEEEEEEATGGAPAPASESCEAVDKSKNSEAADKSKDPADKVKASEAADNKNKLGSKLNLSQREVEEVLAVLRYRARPASPPLGSLPKGATAEDTIAVNLALSKGGAPSLEKLQPGCLLDIGKKQCVATETVQPCSTVQGSNKADRLLQAILRPSKEPPPPPCEGEYSASNASQEAACHSPPANEASHKPTGLERLKHLFNKTISVPSKESVSANTAITSTESMKAVVPSALDKAQFRRSLDSAASMVFRSGLPLTSSPAPVRRGTCFDFDSSINSVQAIRSALFEPQSPASPATSCTDEESCQASPDVEQPTSPLTARPSPKPSWSPTSGALLGTFEESVLNGRLEPVSTVHGFTAELGASGAFCPKHLCLPVTVFFYTLGDNDKVSTPYLGHINLGKKGYSVPRCGTVQVTLFNPLGTVVKMFVVAYDLSDMPPGSQTFLRQRTLYLPAQQASSQLLASQQVTTHQQDEHSNLRYLIHLRFSSSKSGRIFLHSDIRMIIFRKSDEDTATAHAGPGESGAHELRSFISGPTNPKFSPRK